MYLQQPRARIASSMAAAAHLPNQWFDVSVNLEISALKGAYWCLSVIETGFDLGHYLVLKEFHKSFNWMQRVEENYCNKQALLKE